MVSGYRAPRQKGYRYPRHSGASELAAAGTSGMLAALPVFRGESLAGYQADWQFWGDPSSTIDRTYEIISYSAWFPYTWGLTGEALTAALILEMAAEHVYDPVTNVGGDPGGAAGESDIDEWAGEDEFSAAEVIERNWFVLRPYGISHTSTDTVVIPWHHKFTTRQRRNRYFASDGVLAFWWAWTPSPQHEALLGIEVMDANIDPSRLLAATEGGEEGESSTNQLRELIYGGDAYGQLTTHGGGVHGHLLLDSTMRTPYPLPGNSW